MELLLFLILIALIVIIVKLSKISTTKETKNVDVTALDEKINEKIKTSELLLGITYPNIKEIHDRIINSDIDVEYLKEDINFNKVPFDELYGEVTMFKDLESGQLDRSGFANKNLNDIYNKLFLIFHNIDHNKRKSLADDILKNNNSPK